MSVGRALGGAVVRNRIRRRVREILRLRRKEISSGWDVIVHPRSSVVTAVFSSLSEELLGLLHNAIPASPATPPTSTTSVSPPPRKDGRTES
jgi:ribonuclease P protein component